MQLRLNTEQVKIIVIVIIRIVKNLKYASTYEHVTGTLRLRPHRSNQNVKLIQIARIISFIFDPMIPVVIIAM